MVKLGKSPNPEWKPGQKIETPFCQERESFDFSKLSVAQKYSYMNGSIIPRPIAFVSSISAKGDVNLSPFSYYNGVASNPPLIMFSVARKPDGAKKDTLNNILETKEFVVNSSHLWMAEALSQTAADYDSGVNEFAEVGFTEMPSEKVRPPRVQESAVQMECRLEKVFDFGDGDAGSVSVVFGEIVIFHASKTVCQNGMILVDKYQPLSRLGGPLYSKTNEVFKLSRE